MEGGREEEEGGREEGGREGGMEGGREPETGWAPARGRQDHSQNVVAAQYSYRIAHINTMPYCHGYHTIHSCVYTCTCTCTCNPIHLYTKQCPVMNVTSTCA